MDDPNRPPRAMNACTSCKHGKRRCTKSRPACSTCARIGRTCVYSEDLGRPASKADAGRPSDLQASSDSGTPGSLFVPSERLPELFFANPLNGVDPFQHEMLRQPTADFAVSKEARKVLGTLDNVHTIVAKYFAAIYYRMPIISKSRLFEQLPSLFARPRADFSALCLCIHLIQQEPSQDGLSMHSSLYMTCKGIVSLLESTNYLSINAIQCRLLLSFYELGHGIYPAASISIGACARAARALGLNKKGFQTAESDVAARIKLEEEKRVWYAVINLDRFINLSTGDPLFATEDPQSGDPLPIDDIKWARDIVPENNPLTFATPSNVTVGQFARECQISPLVGRVSRHILEPVADPHFLSEEALQLERTLIAFIPLLMEEQRRFGLYCAAFGICNSALIMLYDSILLRSQGNEYEIRQMLRSVEDSAMQIAQFSGQLFGVPENIDHQKMSPLIPYSLYQAGVVQIYLWSKNNEAVYKKALDSLKGILAQFKKRWLIAGTYLSALENLNVDQPVRKLPLQGVYISTRAYT